MSKKWHKGPPPAIGWYVAGCFDRDKDFLRWWDGTAWSIPVYKGTSRREASADAKIRSAMQDWIEWKEQPAHWLRQEVKK